MYSLYAAFVVSLVLTTVVVSVLLPLVVGVFDRRDLF